MFVNLVDIHRECVVEVCEAERNWRGKSSELIRQWQETCLTGPLEYKYRVIFELVLSVICTLLGAVG